MRSVLLPCEDYNRSCFGGYGSGLHAVDVLVMVEALVDMTFRLALVGFSAYGFFWVLSCGDVSSDHGASIGGHRIFGM